MTTLAERIEDAVILAANRRHDEKKFAAILADVRELSEAANAAHDSLANLYHGIPSQHDCPHCVACDRLYRILYKTEAIKGESHG